MIVTYYFPPVGGGGVQRMLKLIKYGSRENWRFTVITATEKSEIQPHDASLLDEIPENTNVIRLPAHVGNQHIHRLLRPLLKAGGFYYLKRWLSAFLYIPDSRKSWRKPAKQAIRKECDRNAYDCILVTSPPYSLLLLAVELQDILDIPVIADMRDNWSRNPFKIYPTPFHHWIDRRIEFKTVSKIQTGVSVYGSLLDFYSKRITGFDAAGWTVLPNGYDEEDFSRLVPHDPEPNMFKIAFAGTFYSHLMNPDYFFKALKHLKEQVPAVEEKLRFFHIGHSFIDVGALARKYGLQTMVRQVGYLDHKNCLELLSSMDTFIYIFEDLLNMIGGRLYEYMRLRKPILALAPEDSELAQLIGRTDSGVVISPYKTKDIANTLRQWMINPPKFSYKNVDSFNRKHQAKQFLRIMERAASYGSS